MKNLRKQTILFLFLMATSVMLFGQELSKNYSESYDVNKDVKLTITSKYGNVTIEAWDKNQVSIDVEITVDAKNEKDSQRILDKISVEMSGSSTAVSAKTEFGGNLNCKNCDFSIDYMVKMPVKAVLDLRNDFGNAYVGDLEGMSSLDVRYGNLEVGKVLGKDSQIQVKFGNGEVDYIKSADIQVEYGNFELGKAEYLSIDTKFSNIEIGEVGELSMDSEYDGVEIGSVDILQLDASFTGIEIGEVFTKAEIESSYGGIEIDRVAGGFSLIDIYTEFGGVELSISSTASYKLEAEASFGDIDFDESEAEVIKLKEESFNMEVEAYVGDDRSSTSVVKLKAKNCDIEIN